MILSHPLDHQDYKIMSADVSNAIGIKDLSDSIYPATPTSLQDWETAISVLSNHPYCIMLLAFKDSKICGSIIISDGSIGLIIAEQHRRKGIGRALLNAAIKAAKHMGLHRLSLSVDKTNDAALVLYRSLGFKVVLEASKDYIMTLHI